MLRRLRAAGSPVEVLDYPSALHGFLTMAPQAERFGFPMRSAEAATRDLVQALGRGFARPWRASSG